MKVSMQTLGGWLLGMYLGIAPVYWFWILPPILLSATKWILIVCGVIFVWLSGFLSRRVLFPRGIIGPFGFILLVIAMYPGLVQSDASTIVDSVLDLLTGFVVLWTFCEFVLVKGDADAVFKRSALVVGIFCMLTVSAVVFGFPNWASPLPEGGSVTTVGFGGKRTGWSVGVAMFTPLALLYHETETEKRKRLVFGGCVLMILASQLVVGGRSGLLASTVSVVVWVLMRPRKTWWLVAVAIVSLLSLDKQWLLSHLRIDRLLKPSSADAWDHFSAGRLLRNMLAVELIIDNPFLGYGFDGLNYGPLSTPEMIHNLWLKLAVQAGVVAPLLFACVVASLVAKGVRLQKVSQASASMRDNVGAALLLVIGMGIIISMFEPNVILGSFQTSAVWWAAAGVLVGLNATGVTSVVGGEAKARRCVHLRSG